MLPSFLIAKGETRHVFRFHSFGKEEKSLLTVVPLVFRFLKEVILQSLGVEEEGVSHANAVSLVYVLLPPCPTCFVPVPVSLLLLSNLTA